MKLIHIGFGNLVNAERVVAVVSPESAPIKRMIQECRENKTLIDTTQGHKTRSVIVMDSAHVILSRLAGEDVAKRLHGEEDGDA